ncbi:hypothetical protein [Mycolicibacterium celeriflavum]|uniref:hypothetical protein n=1 Tax=Mycolicibacterium celeriflavum TaxID=1249101 RepID=UPI003CF35B8D
MDLAEVDELLQNDFAKSLRIAEFSEVFDLRPTIRDLAVFTSPFEEGLHDTLACLFVPP